jgi:hypothetical protein
VPDHWDTKPEDLFDPPHKRPDPAPSGHDEHPTEFKLTNDHGRLRLPAYILIVLVIALAAILAVVAGLLLTAD